MAKKKKDEKSVKQNRVDKIADAVQWVVVGLLVFTSVSLVLSKFNTPLRFRVFSINSGSMAPTIRLGDLVFVRPRPSYQEGDIISFGGRRDPTQVTTHRVVQVSEDIDLGRTTYTTKVDANENPDLTSVRGEQVIGKVVFKLPLLGFLVSIAKTQTGFILLVVIPATILAYTELSNLKQEVSGMMAERREQTDKEKGSKKADKDSKKQKKTAVKKKTKTKKKK